MRNDLISLVLLVVFWFRDILGVFHITFHRRNIVLALSYWGTFILSFWLLIVTVSNDVFFSLKFWIFYLITSISITSVINYIIRSKRYTRTKLIVLDKFRTSCNNLHKELSLFNNGIVANKFTLSKDLKDSGLYKSYVGLCDKFEMCIDLYFDMCDSSNFLSLLYISDEMDILTSTISEATSKLLFLDDLYSAKFLLADIDEELITILDNFMSLIKEV